MWTQTPSGISRHFDVWIDVMQAHDTLSISFGGEASPAYTIGRFLKLSCGDSDLLDELKATTPYQRPKKQPPPPVSLHSVLNGPTRASERCLLHPLLTFALALAA